MSLKSLPVLRFVSAISLIVAPGVPVFTGCSGDGPGVSSYSDFRDDQQLPVDDRSVTQGGDTAQQPLRGGAARTNQSVPNDAEHATNDGQRPPRNTEQGLPRSGGTPPISEEAQQIAEDLVDEAASIPGSPIGQDISAEAAGAITTQCAARCSAAGQCLQSCIAACAALTVLGCVDVLSLVTSCDCNAGASACEELYGSVTLACAGQ
jgi:hypothetical protein